VNDLPNAPPFALGRSQLDPTTAQAPALAPQKVWRHVLLFLLTLATTTWVGAEHHLGFLSEFGARRIPPVSLWMVVTLGLSFSVPFLAFLACHEFGHYFAGRFHGLRPSLPYFLPVPLPLTGTMGAVIFFRGHFPNRRVLFDFAAAGPIAGFVVAVVALALGLAWSPVVRVPERLVGYWLGEPLLFQWLAHLTAGPVARGYSINLHPTALAGWLGLLFTLMNLVPAGQLDGGHIAYAVLGRRARWVTVLSIGGLVGLVIVARAYSWVAWLVLLVAMLRLFGWTHPPAVDDEMPLDRGRLIAVGVVIVIFILCFMPAPISPMEFIGR
jgi:membrane-associated protease RseP (regulator of RpoE activity)